MWIELTEVCEEFENYDTRETKIITSKVLLNLAKAILVRPSVEDGYGCTISTEEDFHIQIEEPYESVRDHFLAQTQKSISVVSL